MKIAKDVTTITTKYGSIPNFEFRNSIVEPENPRRVKPWE